ncbi:MULTISPECIES: hypothetical protein [unclassified Mesorhizobium]|uniref:hypothetical protein n=1 Tax=unclassified Mesorhizobium TaxID=325217 RepID=UPI003337C6D5
MIRRHEVSREMGRMLRFPAVLVGQDIPRMHALIGQIRADTSGWHFMVMNHWQKCAP